MYLKKLSNQQNRCNGNKTRLISATNKANLMELVIEV